jgi:hypothetical protein
MKREPEPLDQTDYGIGYKGNHSPQQHTSVKVEADRAYSTVAMILSFGCIVVIFLAGVLLPAYIKAEAEAAASEANVKVQYAEREARVAIDQVQTMRIELAKKGIVLQLDDHQ